VRGWSRPLLDSRRVPSRYRAPDSVPHDQTSRLALHTGSLPSAWHLGANHCSRCKPNTSAARARADRRLWKRVALDIITACGEVHFVGSVSARIAEPLPEGSAVGLSFTQRTPAAVRSSSFNFPLGLCGFHLVWGQPLAEGGDEVVVCELEGTSQPVRQPQSIPSCAAVAAGSSRSDSESRYPGCE